MAKISPDFLQKLKDAVNIIEVVGEHVVLRKSGANHSGLCPFHNERSPSFSVNEQKQLYHCYGCKKGGDLVGFVMDIHGLSFPEAIEELAERARIPLPKDWGGSSSDDPAQRERRAAAQEKIQIAYKLNRFAAKYFHDSLVRNPQIQQYLRKRGVSDDILRAFYLGAAPAGWDGLAQFLVNAKSPIELAIELGLIRGSKPGAPGVGYFDLFRNRAMFPILDLRGKVAGFGGRILPTAEGSVDSQTAEAGAKEAPKYINSSDSFIFQKGKLAYGLFQAQKHVRALDEVILVEGYFDVLALHAAGFQNAVAICGTSMTHDHLNAFRRLGKKVTLLLDGDKAGIAATERAMETGLERGQVLYGSSIPQGLDPDEVLFDPLTGKLRPEGVEQMRAILAGAEPLLDSRIAGCLRDAQKGPEQRTQALKQVAGWLARFDDAVAREIRMEEVQRGLAISRQLLERAMSAEAGSKGSNSGSSSGRAPAPVEVRRPVSGPGFGPGPHPRPQAGVPGVRGQGQGPYRPQPELGSRGPVPPSSRGARAGAQRPKGLETRDKVLLSAFVRGGRYAELIAEARRKLPTKLTFSDLFDYLPAREFVAALVQEPGAFERFRAAPELVLQGDLDAQVRSTITEALVSPEAPFEDSEVRLALGRATKRALERFSQQIMSAIEDAQAKKDAGLEAQLMAEYLDVKRKIKEFTVSYDEA